MGCYGCNPLWGLRCFYYGCLDTGNLGKPFLDRDAIEDHSCSSPPWETRGLGPYHGILLPLPPRIGRIPAVFMFFLWSSKSKSPLASSEFFFGGVYIYIYSHPDSTSKLNQEPLSEWLAKPLFCLIPTQIFKKTHQYNLGMVIKIILNHLSVR